VGLSPFEALAERAGAWWVDLLGEHNHVGGAATTRWLLERAMPGARGPLLDCGAFVGAAARELATATGAPVVATDIEPVFLATGRQLPGGAGVSWVAADSRCLPFADGTFASAWVLDAQLVPRELSRVAAPEATLCLSCEAPADSRGGLEAFIAEWTAYGWELAAHRDVSLDALQGWRRAEAELVTRRPYFEARYGRTYLRQLDSIARRVAACERGGAGHGLFVFRRALSAERSRPSSASSSRTGS
jgi:SAM-dependent methyltransferase